jgi:hypothetical protein
MNIENNSDTIPIKLVARQLSTVKFDNSHYEILLPGNYEIETDDGGEDFVVYYINRDEITHGGIYFGNHPSSFLSREGYKTTKTIPSKIMGEPIKWEILYNGEKYFTEVIIKNKNGTWDERIHLWVNGTAPDTIENMITCYTTIRKIE